MLGGGLGAGARYGVAKLMPDSIKEVEFPWATLTVNLIGCFLIGLTWQALAKNHALNALFVVGFLGGFTTFSSFGLDGVKLINQGAFTSFFLYLFISNIVGLLFVVGGVKLSEVLRITI